MAVVARAAFDGGNEGQDVLFVDFGPSAVAAAVDESGLAIGAEAITDAVDGGPGTAEHPGDVASALAFGRVEDDEVAYFQGGVLGLVDEASKSALALSRQLNDTGFHGRSLSAGWTGVRNYLGTPILRAASLQRNFI